MADIEQRADVRMLERRDGARLALEAITELRVGSELSRQHLDRNGPVQRRVARAIDLAHPARPERREDLVRAEAPARCKTHRTPRLRVEGSAPMAATISYGPGRARGAIAIGY